MRVPFCVECACMLITCLWYRKTTVQMASCMVLIESLSMNPNVDNAHSSNQRLKAALSWAIVAALLIVIFWMSAKSGSELDERSGIVSVLKAWLANAAFQITGEHVDVSPVGHFLEYLLLGGAVCNALRFTPWTCANKIAGFSIAFLACVFASLYGVSDEFHQIFTPNRSCDVNDWLVDTAAAALGAFAVWLFLRKQDK